MPNTNRTAPRYTIIATNLQTGTEAGRIERPTMKAALDLIRAASAAAKPGTRGYRIEAR